MNGVALYWEARGEGGIPLVVIHGGFGLAGMFADLLDEMAADREVVAVELQGHGHTPDIERPFTYEGFGDDVAGLIRACGFRRADVMGYSLGAGVALRAAIQHPDLVRKLVVVSFPCRSDGWYPDVRSGFDRMDRSLFDMMAQSPLYALWRTGRTAAAPP